MNGGGVDVYRHSVLLEDMLSFDFGEWDSDCAHSIAHRATKCFAKVRAHTGFFNYKLLRG